MKKFVLILFFLAASFIHAQTDEKETLKRLNQNVLLYFNNYRLDDALKLALQVVDMSSKIYGIENPETASAYTNLGIIYREKRKYKTSVENLQKALDIYKKFPNLSVEILIDSYATLAFSQLLDKRKKEAESNYLYALETAQNKFGKDSKETFSLALKIANFYAQDEKYEKADEFYLKSYAIALKNFGKKAKEFEQIDDNRTCMHVAQKIGSEKDRSFDEERDKLLGITRKFTGSKGAGVLNGKALSLPKPPYPDEARAQRASGTVTVKIKIDEYGDVVEAIAICGPPVLRKASEIAARGAKFSPTKLDGKPVKVSGMITYNFVR